MRRSKLLLLALLLSAVCLTAPALAYAEDTGDAEPLTPEGDLTLVDDIEDGDKQFLTVVTRNGHYFYIIVDRAKDGEDTVHFLNQVDESDLLSIIEEKESEETPAVCTCDDKCYPGHVDLSCPVCAVNMTECTGKEPDVPEEPEAETVPNVTETPPEPEKPVNKSTVNPLMTVIALAMLAAGGAFYFLKLRNPKPSARGSADLDEYDYGDEDEESEDAENEDAEK